MKPKDLFYVWKKVGCERLVVAAFPYATRFDQDQLQTKKLANLSQVPAPSASPSLVGRQFYSAESK